MATPDEFDDDLLRISTQSLGFIAERQKELLRLNAELDTKKERVVQHADNVVKEQQDRLRQLMDVGSLFDDDDKRDKEERKEKVKEKAKRKNKEKEKEREKEREQEYAEYIDDYQSASADADIYVPDGRAVEADSEDLSNSMSYVAGHFAHDIRQQRSNQQDGDDVNELQAEMNELSASLRRRQRKTTQQDENLSGSTSSRSGVATAIASPSPSHGHANTSININGAVTRDLPPSAAVRLLQAQVKALEEQSQGLHEVVGQREGELTEALEKIKELEEDGSVFKKAARDAEQQRDKLSKQVKEWKRKAEESHSRYQAASKELAMARKAARKGDSEASALESRLQHMTDELARYKNALSAEKNSRKDGVEKLQRQLDAAVTENKKLQRQKQELLATFKRQMKMIDTLKRQKVLLESSRMLAFSEEEFVKAMDV